MVRISCRCNGVTVSILGMGNRPVKTLQSVCAIGDRLPQNASTGPRPRCEMSGRAEYLLTSPD